MAVSLADGRKLSEKRMMESIDYYTSRGAQGPGA